MKNIFHTPEFEGEYRDRLRSNKERNKQKQKLRKAIKTTWVGSVFIFTLALIGLFIADTMIACIHLIVAATMHMTYLFHCAELRNLLTYEELLNQKSDQVDADNPCNPPENP